MFRWNSKNSTYYSRGRKAYSFGKELPADVVRQMGAETLTEYIKKGLIANDKEKGLAGPKPPKIGDEVERQRLLQTAIDCGMKPHYKTGIPKLRAMIDDYKALQSLKEEALEIGIDPSDDVTFEELSALVDETKTAVDVIETLDESDS